MSTVWDPDLYQDQHAFVWERANDLLEWLNPQPQERILDFGCGTGQLTQALKQTGATVVGVDADPAMVAAAARNYPEIPFYCSDIRHMTLADIQQGPFDAIFSNAVLHWIKPPEEAIKTMWKCLKPGGRLVAEMGGQNNMTDVINALTQALSEFGHTITPETNPWYFPSAPEYQTLLESHGFQVLRIKHFERMTPLNGPDGLADWIRMFANAFLRGVEEAEMPSLLNRVQEIARPKLFQDGSEGEKCWVADYWRLRFEAISATF